MRRQAISIVGLVGLMLVALCAVLMNVALQPPAGLVPVGAQNVQVQRLGIGRQRVTYTMPANKTMANVRQLVQQQGWRRLQGLDEDLGIQFYGRSLFNRTVRVIISLRRPATSRDPVIMEIAQCLRLGDRLICL